MVHKSFNVASGIVPACLAHEPEATGFVTTENDAEVDCPLCRSPRKAKQYARAFAKRAATSGQQPTRLTSRGDVMVVR